MEGNDAPQDAEEDAEQVYQQDEQEGNLVIDLGDGLENMTAAENCPRILLLVSPAPTRDLG